MCGDSVHRAIGHLGWAYANDDSPGLLLSPLAAAIKPKPDRNDLVVGPTSCLSETETCGWQWHTQTQTPAGMRGSAQARWAVQAG
jgi:hypothetical protein